MFDALAAGIEQGGLRDRTQIRLLICYVLKAADQPVLREDILAILQRDGLVNYFEAGEAIAELCQNGNLTLNEADGKSMVRVTETGAKIADTLQRDLPLTVREKAVAAAVKILTRRRRESENAVNIEKTEHGYTVTCTVLDGRTELLTTRLLVSDRMQAELVENQFYEDPAGVYSGVISLLTGDIGVVTEYLKTKKEYPNSAGEK